MVTAGQPGSAAELWHGTGGRRRHASYVTPRSGHLTPGKVKATRPSHLLIRRRGLGYRSGTKRKHKTTAISSSTRVRNHRSLYFSEGDVKIIIESHGLGASPRREGQRHYPQAEILVRRAKPRPRSSAPPCPATAVLNCDPRMATPADMFSSIAKRTLAPPIAVARTGTKRQGGDCYKTCDEPGVGSSVRSVQNGDESVECSRSSEVSAP